MNEETISALKAACPDHDREALGDGHILAALAAFIASPAGQALLSILIGLLPKTPAPTPAPPAA
jgi:hypothetical protein